MRIFSIEKRVYIYGRCTVIDYVMWDEEMRRRIKTMKMGNRIDSDHHNGSMDRKKD